MAAPAGVYVHRYIAPATSRHPGWAILLALPALPAHAQERGWTAEATARVRGEATRDDFRAGAATDEEAILTRLTAFLEYDAGDFEIGGELQDSRVFGEPPNAIDQDDANALEPIQGYVRWHWSGRASLQAGRFTMDLGGRRFVARPNFRNTFTTFSGARLDLADGDRRLVAFWTLPSVRLPDDAAGIAANRAQLDRERLGVQFFGAFASAGDAGRGAFDMTLVRFSERDARAIATRDRRLWGLGLRHHRDPAPGVLDHEIEIATQRGRARGSTSAADLEDRPVRASFVRAAAGYSFGGDWSPRLQLSFDYASGNRRGRRIGRYDTFFGDGAFEFGPSSLFSLVARANLLSGEARLLAAPDAASDGYVAVRPLWLAVATDRFGNSDVIDPAGASGRHAGTLIEVRGRRWLVPERLRLSVGGAYLAKGRFLREAPNAPATGDTRYGYVELTAEF